VAAPIETDTYREVLLFLGTAGVIVPLFRRLRISPVLGFIAAGTALGPFGLGQVAKDVPWLRHLTISDPERIGPIAELGVVFLLFMIGLELTWDRLVRMRRLVFGFGALQVVASAAALGAVALMLGQGATAALVIGGALAMSSTAIVLPVLAEYRRLNSSAGRASFAVLLFQDLAVAPLLILVSALATRGDAASLLWGLWPLVPAIAAVAAVVLLGRLLLRPLFRLVAQTNSTELFMAACLLVIIGTGAVMAASGQSMALGAFIAGMLLAETEYRRQVEVTIEPFQGLLLGLFFVSVGASLDVSRVVAEPAVILGITVGLFLVKAAIIFAAAMAMRMPPLVARQVAFILSPGGEFAFVLLGAALATKLIPADVVTKLTLAVTLSMVLIPVLARILAQAPPAAAGETPPEALVPLEEGAEAVSRVFVVGYGRVGRLIGEMLARHKIPYLSIDSDAALVARERKAGKRIYFGDASRPEFLRRCGIARASALVVTMDAPKAIEEVVAAGRAERPDLTIVARARDAHHAAKLYRLGVTDAVPETIEASLQLSEAVLIDIGVPMGLVIASIHEKRDEFRAILRPARGDTDEKPRAETATRRL
jgi:monovalent cation:H+ antiporter-2, CPA2 family